MEQSLGKRIALHRKRLGLTQDQLAEQLGITAQAVSKWENDQSCPDITTLPKLARIFGITTDALLEGGAEPPVFNGEVVNGQEENEPEGIHIQKGGWNFSWEAGRKGSLLFALLVLAVGVQFLAARLLPTHDLSFWQILWPTTLIVYGINKLMKRLSFTGMGLLLFGGYFLLNYWGALPFQLGGDLVWPVIIVLLGLSLLVDAIGKPKKPRFRFHHKPNADGEYSSSKAVTDYHVDEDSFEYDASFCEDTRFIALPLMRSGEINTSFSHITVDLSAVEAVTNDCHLEVNNSFGELILLVPRCYQLKPESSSAFASINFQGEPDAQPKGIILLEVSTSFGSTKVRYI